MSCRNRRAGHGFWARFAGRGLTINARCLRGCGRSSETDRGGLPSRLAPATSTAPTMWHCPNSRRWCRHSVGPTPTTCWPSWWTAGDSATSPTCPLTWPFDARAVPYRPKSADEVRRNMSAIRSTGGKTEVALRSLLHRRGLRFRKNDARLVGKPDIVFPPRPGGGVHSRRLLARPGSEREGARSARRSNEDGQPGVLDRQVHQAGQDGRRGDGDA